MSYEEKIHYLETTEKRRARLNSTTVNSQALCGNGSAHQITTLNKSEVECKHCLFELGMYYFNPPPVLTTRWTNQDWINYIDNNGKWMNGVK